MLLLGIIPTFNPLRFITIKENLLISFAIAEYSPTFATP